MTVDEIRSKYLGFFKARGHAVIPSASLVPENDPSVLFNTAGMQPLVPYLMGEPHPSGSKRIVDIQKCLRTNDIEEVGDNTHLTFFEMLGNWSLGDYFKKEAITWSYELLTSKEEGFGLDPRRLYVTVFEGDENAPRDEEAAEIWKEIFQKEGLDPSLRIFFLDADSNWWSPGDNGPCGPDTEMFYDVSGTLADGLTKEEFLAADDRQDVVEIWNDVFMEYEKKDGKVIGKLANKNVDTGSGLERVASVVQGKNNVFETDIFLPILHKIQELQVVSDPRAERIIADHMRAAVFLIADGVIPSNTDQGYILRRLLRRAIRQAAQLRIVSVVPLVKTIVEQFAFAYPELKEKREKIEWEIAEEEKSFRSTLDNGLRRFEHIAERAGKISGRDAFVLFSTYGFPYELTEELARERNLTIDRKEFEKEMQKHQELSRAGAKQKFKGGLADHSEMAVKYHTATHLLHRALKDVLGEEVAQKGSNITPERLRFDFAFARKMTDEEKQKVEKIINEKIKAALPVSYEDIALEEARKRGAIGLFGEKYGDIVRLYTIGDYSTEFCGGPHVENTSDLGRFAITKEEAVSAGTRRIRAVLS